MGASPNTIFYMHKHGILDLKVDVTKTSRNGKESKRKGTIKERVNKEDYCVEL